MNIGHFGEPQRLTNETKYLIPTISKCPTDAVFNQSLGMFHFSSNSISKNSGLILREMVQEMLQESLICGNTTSGVGKCPN
jgi:hypothetical protein